MRRVAPNGGLGCRDLPGGLKDVLLGLPQAASKTVATVGT
jgi:hypothetical protein